MASRVLDRAMQVHGAGGLGPTFPLARMYTESRIVRMADGPDEVHRRSVAATELRRFEEATSPAPHGVTAHLTTTTASG
jgi:acyl-CoA dehydrogenase